MDKDEIILIVKKAIANNSIPFNDSDEFVKLDGFDVDSISVEVYEALHNAGYRKTFTSDLASDTQKAFKEGYEKGCEACAQSWDNGYNDGYESGKEDGVKEFAERLKDLLYTVYGKHDAPLGDLTAEDIACEIDELLKEWEK